MEEGRELFDKYDFSNPPAGCPECGRRVLLVDEEDEMVFCPDDEMNRGCGWMGKICQMDFDTKTQKNT